ncbi:MAG: hypothetical protein ACFHHU_00540 [Porticoccaceae bacterium]
MAINQQDEIRKLCANPTWSSGHDLDKERFHGMLHRLLQQGDFSPEKMREDFEAVLGPSAGIHRHKIQEFTDAAWAVVHHINTK